MGINRICIYCINSLQPEDKAGTQECAAGLLC